MCEAVNGEDNVMMVGDIVHLRNVRMMSEG